MAFSILLVSVFYHSNRVIESLRINMIIHQLILLAQEVVEEDYLLAIRRDEFRLQDNGEPVAWLEW